MVIRSSIFILYLLLLQSRRPSFSIERTPGLDSLNKHITRVAACLALMFKAAASFSGRLEFTLQILPQHRDTAGTTLRSKFGHVT